MSHRPIPTLLLIDDSPQQLRTLSAALTPQFQIRFASDGPQAVLKVQAQRPDLILFRSHVTGIDGLATCRVLKAAAECAAIPVIVLTEEQDTAQRIEGFRLGAVDCISAPFCNEELLARIKHCLPASQPSSGCPATAQPAGATESSHVNAAASYIAEHLHQLPSVEVIARRVGVSEKRLVALFHKHLDLTVSAFIRNERIRISQKLLLETKLPIQEIASEVGFSCPANFSTAFRERTGMTPAAFRQTRGAPPPVVICATAARSADAHGVPLEFDRRRAADSHVTDTTATPPDNGALDAQGRPRWARRATDKVQPIVVNPAHPLLPQRLPREAPKHRIETAAPPAGGRVPAGRGRWSGDRQPAEHWLTRAA